MLAKFEHARFEVCAVRFCAAGFQFFEVNTVLEAASIDDGYIEFWGHTRYIRFCH
jgi:hypothetical protein